MESIVTVIRATVAALIDTDIVAPEINIKRSTGVPQYNYLPLIGDGRLAISLPIAMPSVARV